MAEQKPSLLYIGMHYKNNIMHILMTVINSKTTPEWEAVK